MLELNTITQTDDKRLKMENSTQDLLSINSIIQITSGVGHCTSVTVDESYSWFVYFGNSMEWTQTSDNAFRHPVTRSIMSDFDILSEEITIYSR